MKKIYSLVLMATMLLIGTNSWGVDITTYAQLQDTIDKAGLKKDVGTVKLKLGADITMTANQTVCLKTDSVNHDIKSIELDLNGHDIKLSSNSSKNTCAMFVVTHGELLVRNTGTRKSQLILYGPTQKNSTIFSLYGSYKSSRWVKSGDEYVAQAESKIINTRNEGYFTHVEIGENIELYADGCDGTAIVIDDARTDNFATTKAGIKYNTNIFDGSYGLAQGVRLDIKGEIDFSNIGTSAEKSYGIKINGLVWTTLTTEKEKALKGTFAPDPAYLTHFSANRTAHQADTIDAPYVHIYSTARIKSKANSTEDNSTAVYISGYGKVVIDGAYCEGNTALYASSGDILVNDATLHSTATQYTTPSGAGSANGGGSTLVLNARDSYAGGIDIKITGDTKITSEAGYAIESKNNAAQDTAKVSGLHIESATIEGGDMGAIIIEPKDKDQSSIVVANITGSVTTTDSSQPISVEDLIVGEHHTTVVDGVTVISEGEAPASKNTWADIVAAQGADKDYTWQTAEAAVIGDGSTATTVTLGNLEMNAGTSGNLQSITIKDKASLEANYLLMNDYARIIIEAGGKLIVKGENGIYSNKVDNIVLHNEENKPAVFLLHPSVNFNQHPKATVEFISKGFNNTAAGTYGWQKFGVPTQTTELTAISIEGNVPTAFAKFNYDAETPAWEIIGYLNHTPALKLSDLAQAFEYYQMEHNTATVGTKVTFKGKLVGNDCPAPVIRGKFWNGYANSYSAPIDGNALMALIPAPADQSFYLYEYDNLSQKFAWVAKSNLKMSSIQPMQPFLVRNRYVTTAALAMDYAAAVYNPATTPSNAPAARRNNDMTKVEFIVRGENGVDHVIVAQDAQFSAEFDNGYDVTKYMNDDVNMYVSAEEKMAIYATDNLENTYVGIQTVSGGNYTIEFAEVQGEELTLIDHETNARVAMVAGSKYEFTTAANSVNDYRFEIVASSEVPTAIENTEAVKSAKGIYTVTGQYVGEMNVWNTLPAGVYVINGEKRVK